MSETVEIDGSFGEGGGQIIRTSLSLAAITGTPVTIFNVRARRTRPGLQPQHLTAVRAAAEICGARLDGAAVGSTAFTFTPGGPVRAGDYRFDIGTAGATPLVAQTVLVPLALAEGPSRVTVIGGTHVPHAPDADYLETVYVSALRCVGYEARFRYDQAGFYPRGGGEIQLEIRPADRVRPLEWLERGRVRGLAARVVTAQLPEHVGQRGAAAVERFLKGVGRKAAVDVRDLPSRGPGAAVTLVAELDTGYAGFTGLGARGRPMESVAEEACKQWLAWSRREAPVDEHLADQLVLPLALAAGESRWHTPEVTEHLRTVLWVTRRFLPVEADLEEREDGSGLVTLRGTG